MTATGLVAVREITIDWGDCDPAGIVFYPRYFAYFDACTAGLFAAAGLPKWEMVRTYDIIGIPMVDTRARFYIPSTWGDRVRVESRIAGWGRSSFEVAHRVLKGDRLAIEAEEKRVWVGRHPRDPGRLKARPVPEAVIARFGPVPVRATGG